MREVFKYEKCDEIFSNYEECLFHEKFCGKPIIYKCDKCGNEEDVTDDKHGWKKEGWHHIDLGRPGYGSGFDGCDVAFTLCDDCLHELVDSFTLEGQEKIYNSGNNVYLSSEDWIRVQKGEMPDEEMEEKGMYSPRQIKAYEERFPTCGHVKIVEYDDGSRGSHCHKFAFGDKHGKCGVNISDNCFRCKDYIKREEGKEIPIEYRYD